MRWICFTDVCIRAKDKALYDRIRQIVIGDDAGDEQVKLDLFTAEFLALLNGKLHEDNIDPTIEALIKDIGVLVSYKIGL